MTQTEVSLTKEQIMQELEQLPQPLLLEVLKVARALQDPSEADRSEASKSVRQSDGWAAYLASKQERAEVYRRLANS